MASNGNVDVSQLSDAELATMLRQHGAACGPIISKFNYIGFLWLYRVQQKSSPL